MSDRSPISSDSNPKIAFFHVMKTGGVTFRRILSTIYEDAFQVCYDPTVDAVQQVLTRSQCIEFHSFQFQGRLTNMHSELARLNRWDVLDGCACFTMLREPVDQMISLYQFVTRQRFFVEPVYLANGLTFPESLEQYVESSFHFNLQTAFLADRYPLEEGSAVSAQDLTRAKDMLQRVQMHVGLTERFADSMNVFEAVSGRVIPGTTIHNENRNPDRVPVSAIPEKLKEKIREHNHLDLELYALGQEMFQQDFARCGPTRDYVFVTAKSSEAGTVTASPAMPHARTGKSVFFAGIGTGAAVFSSVLSSLYDGACQAVMDASGNAIEAAVRRQQCIEFRMMPQRLDVLEGADIFIMFRDPVEQVVAHYRYLREHAATMRPVYKASGLPFPASLEEYFSNPAHFNAQLAFLAGKSPLKPEGKPNGADLNNVKEWMIRLGAHPMLNDRFAESVHVLETVTGRLVPGAKIPNPERTDEVPAEVKARIHKASALDMELYEFARTLFMKDTAACGPTRQYVFVDEPAAAPRRSWFARLFGG